MRKNVIKEIGKMLSLEVIMFVFVNWLEIDLIYIFYIEFSLMERYIYIRKLVKIEIELGVLRVENFFFRLCALLYWLLFCLKM